MDGLDTNRGAGAISVTLAPLGDASRRVFERLSRLGLRYVQLSASQDGTRPRELGQSGRRDLLAALRRREMSPSGIDVWIPGEHYIDAACADRAVAATTAAIDLAADLGRVPVSLNLPGGGSDEERAAIDAICDAIVERADRVGVELADHQVPDLARAGIGAGLDPPAWLARDRDPAVELARLAPRLVTARLCDLLTSGQRGPVGRPTDGRLDVRAYQAAVSAAGIRRPLVVDARQWSDPWGGLAQTMEAWDAVV